MKILHVSTGFPLSYPGGITNYVRALAQSQIEMGMTVHVLARPDAVAPPNGCTMHPYTASTVRPFSVKNVEVDPCTSQITMLLEREHFDLVHFHMALDLPLKFLEDFPLLKQPYLVSLHDYFYICPRIFMVDIASEVCRFVDLEKCKRCIGFLDQVDILRRAANKARLTLPRIPSDAVVRRAEAMRRFLTSANILLAVSTRTGAIYQQAVPPARIRVEQIGSIAATRLSMAKNPSEKLRVTALSTLNKVKGAEVLEQIIKLVRRDDIEFHFYGRTFDGYEERLRSLGMYFHGPYTPANIPEIMANTDLGLVLSIWEDNGPQVAMEFMSNLVPVLGTLRGGIPDIVSPGSSFLFDPAIPEELARAAAWLQMLDKPQLAKLALNIQPLLTPAEHAVRVSNIYSEIIHPAIPV